jgi:hypothetical protein
MPNGIDFKFLLMPFFGFTAFNFIVRALVGKLYTPKERNL